MLKNALPALVFGALAMVSVSCKKEKTEPTPTPTTTTGNQSGVNLPGAHDGAMYAALTYIQGDLASSYAYAWFGNDQNSSSAGTVILNQESLFRDEESDDKWYNYIGEDTYDSCHWSTTGTSAFPSINYTDNQSFGPFSNLNVPSSVANGQGLTVSFSTPANTKEVYVIIGNHPYPPTAPTIISKTVGAGAKTVSFTAAQIQSMKTDFGSFTFEAFSINYELKTFGAKKYYFVKQVNQLFEIENN